MKFGSIFASVGFSFLAVVACSSNDTPTDGGTDAAIDVKPDKAKLDAAVDAGGCPSGLVCENCDGGYTPVPMVAPYASAAACTASDIAAFVAACGNAGSDAACGNWQNAEFASDAGCYDCVYSPDTGSNWGVFVCNQTNTCSYNYGGCFDVALGTVSDEQRGGGAGSCGDVVKADFDCEDYACSTCTGADYDTCVTSVDSNACSTYADAYDSATGPCAVLDDASATVNACFLATDNDLSIMTTLMCGTKNAGD